MSTSELGLLDVNHISLGSGWTALGGGAKYTYNVVSIYELCILEPSILRPAVAFTFPDSYDVEVWTESEGCVTPGGLQ